MDRVSNMERRHGKLKARAICKATWVGGRINVPVEEHPEHRCTVFDGHANPVCACRCGALKRNARAKCSNS